MSGEATNNQEEVLQILQDREKPLSRQQIFSHCQITLSLDAVSKALNSLQTRGLVHKIDGRWELKETVFQPLDDPVLEAVHELTIVKNFPDAIHRAIILRELAQIALFAEPLRRFFTLLAEDIEK